MAAYEFCTGNEILIEAERNKNSGVKPYKCPSCDKAFTQRCSLESHTKKVHGMDLPYGYKQRRTKVYVCEDCGYSTSDPEEHFRHLQQNQPFCPALQRCHDKRQFKFRADQQASKNKDTSDDNTLYDDNRDLAELRDTEETANRFNHCEVDERTETEAAVEHLQDMNEKDCVDYSRNPAERSEQERMRADERHNDKSAESPQETVLGEVNKNTNVISSSLETQSVSSCVSVPKEINTNRDVYAPFITTHTGDTTNTGNVIQTISEPTKRLAVSEPANVSPKKKLKSVNSPKKNKSTSSPMKVRPLQFGVSENVGSIPKYDVENVVSKKSSENAIKKRPLGSLTQNTINQQKNNLNVQFNSNNVPAVKKPLGNIMENMQW